MFGCLNMIFGDIYVIMVFNSGFMRELRNSLFGGGREKWGRGRWWWWRPAQQGTADY